MASTVIINPKKIKIGTSTVNEVSVGTSPVRRIRTGSGTVLYDRKVYTLNKIKSTTYPVGINGGSVDISSYVSSYYTNLDGDTGVSYSTSPSSISSNSGNTSTRTGNITVTQNVSDLSVAIPYSQSADSITGTTTVVTSIALSLSLVPSIPASGGTVSSTSYSVTAYGYTINRWASGNSSRGGDVSFDCTSSASVQWTGVTAGSRGTTTGATRIAGILYATASYSGCYDSKSATVYQSANSQSGPYYTGLTVSLGIPAVIPASGGTVSSTSYNGTATGYYSYTSGAKSGASTTVSPTMSWTGVTAGSRGTTTGATRDAGTLYGQGTWNSLTSNKASVSVQQEANQRSGPYRNGLVITIVGSPATIPASGGTISSYNTSGYYTRYYSYTSNATSAASNESCSPTLHWGSPVSANSLYDNVTSGPTYIDALSCYGTSDGFTSSTIYGYIYQDQNSVVSSSTRQVTRREDEHQYPPVVTGTTNSYYAPYINPSSGSVASTAGAITITAYAYHDSTPDGYTRETWTNVVYDETTTVYTSTYTGTTTGPQTRTPQTADTEWHGTTTQVQDNVKLSSKPAWVTSVSFNSSNSAATINYSANQTTASRSGNIVFANQGYQSATATYRLTQNNPIVLYVIIRRSQPMVAKLSTSYQSIEPVMVGVNIDVINLNGFDEEMGYAVQGSGVIYSNQEEGYITWSPEITSSLSRDSSGQASAQSALPAGYSLDGQVYFIE